MATIRIVLPSATVEREAETEEDVYGELARYFGALADGVTPSVSPFGILTPEPVQPPDEPVVPAVEVVEDGE